MDLVQVTEAAETLLAMAGIENAVIIVTDGVTAIGSVPKDPTVAAALFMAALDDVPKLTKEAVKEYLDHFSAIEEEE